MDNQNQSQCFEKQILNREFHLQYQGKYKKQDVYSTLINYNIGSYYNNICNKLVENKIRKKNPEILEDNEYKIDFANLITNLK